VAGTATACAGRIGSNTQISDGRHVTHHALASATGEVAPSPAGPWLIRLQTSCPALAALLALMPRRSFCQGLWTVRSATSDLLGQMT
jgi:hypothetical protein